MLRTPLFNVKVTWFLYFLVKSEFSYHGGFGEKPSNETVARKPLLSPRVSWEL